MTLLHPFFLYIGLPVFAAAAAAVLLIRKHRKESFRGGLRAANTQLLRELPEYKKLLLRYRILSVLLVLGLLLSMTASLLMLARPASRRTQVSGVKKRDIFLCLDVSYSLYELNYDLVDTLEAVVAGLEGDRFGVSIYNTSTVLYVPMTDDYDFVIERLEELKGYFLLQKDYMEQFGSYSYLSEIPEEELERYYELSEEMSYLEAGTLTNNYRRGSSLIGEGLASCLFNFPHLEDSKRTRVIIMATDNDQQDLTKPVVELPEAADLCRGHDVTVFGVFPGQDQFDYDQAEADYDRCLSSMQESIEKTGGTFYVAGTQLSVPDIVRDIERQEAMAVNTVSVTRMVDEPQLPAVLMALGLVLSAVSAALLKA